MGAGGREAGEREGSRLAGEGGDKDREIYSIENTAVCWSLKKR